MFPLQNKELVNDFVRCELRKGLRVKIPEDNQGMTQDKGSPLIPMGNRNAKRNLEKKIVSSTSPEANGRVKARSRRYDNNLLFKKVKKSGVAAYLNQLNVQDPVPIRLKPVYSTLCIAKNGHIVKVMKRMNNTGPFSYSRKQSARNSRHKVWRSKNPKPRKRRETSQKFQYYVEKQGRIQKDVDEEKQQARLNKALKQIMEHTADPSANKNIVGPLARVRAEGVTLWTNQVEDLVGQSANGAIKKNLKVVKKKDTWVQFETRIKKVGAQAVPPRTNFLSLLRPFLGINVPQQSKSANKAPVRPGLKLPWIRNIPFFTTNRHPPGNEVKVFKYEATRKSKEPDQHFFKLTTRDVATCTSEKETAVELENYESIRAICVSKRYRKIRKVRFRKHHSTESNSTLSPSVSRTKSVVRKHRRSLIEQNPPIRAREVHLAIDREMKRTTMKREQVSRLSSDLDTTDVFVTPNEIPTGSSIIKTRPWYQGEKKYATLHTLPSLFKSNLERLLRLCFTRAFEINIQFVNPYELDTCIQKNFTVTKNRFQKRTFDFKNRAQIISIDWDDVDFPEEVRLPSISVPSFGLSIHDDKFCLENLELSLQTVEKEMKSVFLDAQHFKCLKTEQTFKRGKARSKSQKENARSELQKQNPTKLSQGITSFHKTEDAKGAGDRRQVSSQIHKSNLLDCYVTYNIGHNILPFGRDTTTDIGHNDTSQMQKCVVQKIKLEKETKASREDPIKLKSTRKYNKPYRKLLPLKKEERTKSRGLPNSECTAVKVEQMISQEQLELGGASTQRLLEPSQASDENWKAQENDKPGALKQELLEKFGPRARLEIPRARGFSKLGPPAVKKQTTKELTAKVKNEARALNPRALKSELIAKFEGVGVTGGNRRDEILKKLGAGKSSKKGAEFKQGKVSGR